MAPESHIPAQLDSAKHQFLNIFKLVLWGAMVLLAVSLLGTIAVTIWSSTDSLGTVMAQMFTVRLLQLTIGMLAGMTAMLLGVILALLGIVADYQVEGETASMKMKIASASPGILLVICGTVILLTCLLKPVTPEQFEAVPPAITMEQMNLPS